MANDDGTKSIRIREPYHDLIGAVSAVERRHRTAQLELLIEAGARELGHEDLLAEHVPDAR